jgi:hypothetical protein
MKIVCTLLLPFFLVACVAKKPVATSQTFLSEWSPELSVSIPKGFKQIKPFILDSGERGNGIIREEHYPYVECSNDGSIIRVLTISIMASISPMTWSQTTIYHLKKDTNHILPEVVTISNQPYISAFSPRPLLHSYLMEKLGISSSTTGQIALNRVYVSTTYGGERVIINYMEVNDQNVQRMFNAYFQKVSQNSSSWQNFSDIPIELKEIVTNFIEKADSILSAKKTDEIPIRYQLAPNIRFR